MTKTQKNKNTPMTSKEIEANSFYYLLKRNNLGNGIQFKYQVSIYVYLRAKFQFQFC